MNLRHVIVPVAFAAPLFWASQAQAGIESCGDIHVEAEAECEVLAGAECTAECEPLAFEAECAAELYVSCTAPSMCSASFSAECAGSCEADCMGRCEAQPAMFDCRADCVANARAEAMGRCGTGDSECVASAEATFEAECSASCEAQPAMVECAGSCQASCEGRCTAEANVDCQIECQREGYVECKSSLTGGCKADCDVDAGLFCDGQWVDHGGHLDDCVSSLRAYLSAHVETYAEGSCEPGHCEGEAGFSCSCVVDKEREQGNLWWLFAGIGVAGLTFRRRRS